MELCRFSNTAGLRRHGVLVDRLAQIDPLTPVTPLVVATYNILIGQHADAAPAARRAIEQGPDASMLHILAAWWLGEAGWAPEACRILARLGRAMGEAASGSWARFLEAALKGDVQRAIAVVAWERTR